MRRPTADLVDTPTAPPTAPAAPPAAAGGGERIGGWWFGARMRAARRRAGTRSVARRRGGPVPDHRAQAATRAAMPTDGVRHHDHPPAPTAPLETCDAC